MWRNSTVSSDSQLQTGHWRSDQHHLVCFRQSSSSVPGSFVPVSLQSLLTDCGIVAPHVPGAAFNFPTWGSGVCRTAHRMWLRTLSTALEEESKVLDEA